MARTNRGGSRRSGGDPKKSVAPQDEEFVELDPDELELDALEDSDDDPDEDADEDAGALGSALSGSSKAKSKKSKGSSRRERIAALQEREGRDKRARSIRLTVLCVVLALVVLAYPVYLFVEESIITATPREQIGVPASEAGCLPDEENPATGNQEHVPDGTIVDYPRLPPDSGPHYGQWTNFGETFYSISDRPEIERLVHSLEHGYTLLWYNSDTITPEELKWVEALAKTFNGSDPVLNKFKAAPWSPTYDGGGFPDDTKFILTRWTADPQNPADVTKQFGVRMACNQLSGQAVDEFMERYPQPNSPEPGGA